LIELCCLKASGLEGQEVTFTVLKSQRKIRNTLKLLNQKDSTENDFGKPLEW
tara:strand:- start:206 stop:361 length:156 start_codon:yes stop_codon:yes gene_type:complete